MTRAAIIAAVLLYAGAATADQLLPPPLPLNGTHCFINDQSVMAEWSSGLAQARAICVLHSVPTNTLLSCPDNPMCNRTYKDEWREACIEIDRRWREEGHKQRADDAAEQDRLRKEARDLDFVRGVAGMKDGGR